MRWDHSQRGKAARSQAVISRFSVSRSLEFVTGDAGSGSADKGAATISKVVAMVNVGAVMMLVDMAAPINARRLVA